MLNDEPKNDASNKKYEREQSKPMYQLNHSIKKPKSK